MLISPTVAIENKWITGITNPASIQPNAIDFTADQLMQLARDGTFSICDNKANTRMLDHLKVPIMNGSADVKDAWVVKGGYAYEITSDLYVNVPEGVICELIVRSTFSRNGMFLTSGIYDQGFKGHIGCVLHVPYTNGFVEKGVRIGQIKFWQAQSAGQMYAGGWNHSQGSNWYNDTYTTNHKIILEESK